MKSSNARSGAGFDDDDPHDLARLSFLASALAGRPVDVTYSAKGAARTDGHTIFVCEAADRLMVRKQVLVQSALLAAGMTADRLKPLRLRHNGLRRYFLLQVVRAASLSSAEGAIIRRGVGDLPSGVVAPRDDDDARRRAAGAEALPPTPPSWGVIDIRLLTSSTADHGTFVGRPSPAAPREESCEDTEPHDDGASSASLFSAPLGSSVIRRLLEKLAGAEQARSATDPDGAEVSTRASMSWASTSPTQPHTSWLGDKGRGSDPPGISRLKYPEWNHRTNTFNPEWCHVSVLSLHDGRAVGVASRGGRAATSAAAARGPLLRALLPIGLRPAPVGGFHDGRDLDLDAAIDAISDPGADQDTIYVESLPRRRELGVLVLLDSSASTRDPSWAGDTVFSRQLQVASAILEVTTRLDCRTAALAFQSLGRKSVKLIHLKAFDEPIGAGLQRRLKQISPAGYTRTGAAIRHSTHLLKSRSGVPRGILVVVTDGFPYDVDYTGDYAQADTAHALEEARASGIGCVCLSVGSNQPGDALARVFGSTTTAILSDASELAPIARRLFTDALNGADLRRRPAG